MGKVTLIEFAAVIQVGHLEPWRAVFGKQSDDVDVAFLVTHDFKARRDFQAENFIKVFVDFFNSHLVFAQIQRISIR